MEGAALEEMLDLVEAYDGEDRWYRETLGLMFEGSEGEAYAELSASFSDTPLAWNARFEVLAWRLHPASAVPAFLARAMSLNLDEPARRRSIDGLAFAPGRPAVDTMVTAATAGPEDLRGYAQWWLQHRDTNDWRDCDLLSSLKKGRLQDAETVFESRVARAVLIH